MEATGDLSQWSAGAKAQSGRSQRERKDVEAVSPDSTSGKFSWKGEQRDAEVLAGEDRRTTLQQENNSKIPAGRMNWWRGGNNLAEKRK